MAVISFFFHNDLRSLKFLASFSIPIGWFTLIVLSAFHGAVLPGMFLHILHKRFVTAFVLCFGFAVTFGSGFVLISYTDDMKEVELRDGIFASTRYEGAII